MTVLNRGGALPLSIPCSLFGFAFVDLLLSSRSKALEQTRLYVTIFVVQSVEFIYSSLYTGSLRQLLRVHPKPSAYTTPRGNYF